MTVNVRKPNTQMLSLVISLRGHRDIELFLYLKGIQVQSDGLRAQDRPEEESRIEINGKSQGKTPQTDPGSVSLKLCTNMTRAIE